MVKLSPYPTMDTAAPTPPSLEILLDREDLEAGGGLGVDSADTPPVCLEVSTASYGYETYIEDRLTCLKHKVRNMEKKKQKLEGYKKRMSQGEVLNKDQLAAVKKYEELLHHLTLARELHKTLDCLAKNPLSAQKNAVKQEEVGRMEMERRRLTLVLQVQHLLTSLQQEHIQKDLLSSHNQAPHLAAQKLHSLKQLATQLGVKRDRSLRRVRLLFEVCWDTLRHYDCLMSLLCFSIEEPMKQAALVYLDLLEGKDKPVAGSSSIKLKPNEVSMKNWQEVFEMVGDGEPPESWEIQFPDRRSIPQPLVHKPWRGAATLIPKVLPVKKQSAESKKRTERKIKVDQSAKFALDLDLPMEIFSSPCAFPKDPVLRKQHLEDFMTKIHGSFSFIQESLLDGETSPTDPRVKRLSSKSPTSLVQPVIRSLADALPKPMHSTPLPTRLLMHQTSLANGDEAKGTFDLELSLEDLPYEPLQLSGRKLFPSPTLYRKDSTVSSLGEKSNPWIQVPALEKESPCHGVESRASTHPQGPMFLTPPTRQTFTSAQFQSIQSVCMMKASLPRKLISKSDSAVLTDLRHNSVGTQTPPELATPEDELQSGPAPVFVTIIESSKEVVAYYFPPVCERSFVPQILGDFGPLLCPVRDPVCQHAYRQEGRQNSRAWNDSYQVSSPDQEGTFTITDSCLRDSLSVSTVEIPHTPNSHQQHPSLVPMWLYSLYQPLRVAFTASRTANFAPGNLDQPVVFDHLYSNLGGMYDAHIGRFTCPVNGTYVFIFHILKLAINVPLYINLMHNEDVVVSAYANDGAPDHETASNHAILPLFQGDQVWLRLHRGAIYGSTWKYSTFSGFLLYQD